MPSATVQSRIQAFEALSSSSSSSPPVPPPPADDRTPSLLESPISPAASTFHPIAPLVAPTSTRSRSPSPSIPSLACQSSLIDLKDWIVEDGPVEGLFVPRRAGIGRLNDIRESSRTPSPSRAPMPSSAPLINFEPPPQTRPPLPPRKPSFPTAERATTQRTVSAGSETGATLRPPGRSDPLPIEHTYPPSAHKFGAARVGHAPTSSISSFHSVSLSSDGSAAENQSPKSSSKPPSSTFEAEPSTTDFDTASIAESFENVSAPSAASPLAVIPFDWERAIGKSKAWPKPEPPDLPNRPGAMFAPVAPPPKPLARSVSASSSSTAASTKTRRPPPPPPPPYHSHSRPSSSRASIVSTSASTSDRSSILSSATTTSRTSISTRNSTQLGPSLKSSPPLRPTPVPPAAQARYESLFDSAVQGRRSAEREAQRIKSLAPPPLPAKKGRQAAGWRGLSVDLIANPEDRPILSLEKRPDETDDEGHGDSLPVGPAERLNGRIVKYIWSASRLDYKKLSSIWNDCDPHRTGFLDREAFVRGMWRIDEELRGAQLARRTSALAAASSQRIPHRPLPPPWPPRGTTTPPT